FSSLFLYCALPPLHLHSFPTRRSSDLNGCRSFSVAAPTASFFIIMFVLIFPVFLSGCKIASTLDFFYSLRLNLRNNCPAILNEPDRKSTRLNSSHDQISYAVFCLKKKI